MPYLIDSDVFLQAKNRHYGFDFCPAFWDWLVAKHAAGVVFSVAAVGGEISPPLDDLGAWARAMGDSFFLPPDAGVTASLPIVSAWAADPAKGYTQAALTKFLASADYYLIGHAHAHGFTVVTHEVPANTPSNVKIPTACAGLGVECIDPFRMLRREAASFILPPTLATLAAPAVTAGAVAVPATPPAPPPP